MTSLLRKLTAAFAAMFTVAGLSLVTSAPVSARPNDPNCTLPDLRVSGGQVEIDNGSATWRIDGRTVHAQRVAPWTIQGGSIVTRTNQGPTRKNLFFDPGDIHYTMKSDEVEVISIAVFTDIPMCGEEQTPQSDSCGYYLIGKDGGVFTYGDARFFGSTGAMRLNQPIFGMASTKSGNGYWLVAYDGGIFSFGDAKFFGSTGAMRLNQPITGMARTATGNGYWLVARDGGIFTFGDAKFFGSAGGMKLSAPVVSFIATQSGNGYWLVTADAKVLAFGDARNWGDGGRGTIVGGTATGDGYRYVNTVGDVFGSTSAGKFQASGPGTFKAPVIGVANDPDSSGYWLAAADGSVYPVGTSSYCGSAGSLPLNQPIIGFAAVGIRS